MRCAKFGVAVCMASMLDWRRGGQSVIGICALFYIYRSAMRCAKFGVAVCKASMLDCRGQSAMGICTLFYIYIDLP